MRLLYEKSRPGRRAGRLPESELPAVEVPAELRRASPPRLPEISEPELLRHFTELSTRTFGIDTGFYPLGSCTMKHNPRVNERVVSLPGFRDLHPHQEIESCQGALELMWRLEQILQEVAGLDAVTLQPAAGSQGELLGLLLMQGLPRRPGRGGTSRGDRPGHRARDEPGECHDGRLHARRSRDRPPRERRSRPTSGRRSRNARPR